MQKEKLEIEKKILKLNNNRPSEKTKRATGRNKIRERQKRDLQKFIRAEQALVRKEQAERQRKILEQIKLEKKIEQFRKEKLKKSQN